MESAKQKIKNKYIYFEWAYDHKDDKYYLILWDVREVTYGQRWRVDRIYFTNPKWSVRLRSIIYLHETRLYAIDSINKIKRHIIVDIMMRLGGKIAFKRYK